MSATSKAPFPGDRRKIEIMKTNTVAVLLNEFPFNMADKKGGVWAIYPNEYQWLPSWNERSDTLFLYVRRGQELKDAARLFKEYELPQEERTPETVALHGGKLARVPGTPKPDRKPRKPRTPKPPKGKWTVTPEGEEGSKP